MTPADISVVIPAINEEANIAVAIRSAFRAGAGEVIVVDGGSNDQTIDVANTAHATLVQSPAGRGTQLNAGASVAAAEFVLFLHADNRLATDCLQQICDQGDCTWGAFRHRIDSPRTIFRMIEFGNALRVTYRHLPFGDQCIFVRRSAFNQAGRFAEIPLMEDVEFSRRMAAISKPQLLEGPITISARRWEKFGVLRQTLRNWSLQVRYAWGASPEQLKQRYE